VFPRELQHIVDFHPVIDSGGIIKWAAFYGRGVKQEYAIAPATTETRILNRVISNILQQNVLVMNLSSLIHKGLLKIGE
jgi:hypothetical protein